MRAKRWQNVTALGLILIATSQSEASQWKALREGFEAVAKRSGKALQENAEASAKRSASRRALLEGLERGAGTAGGRIGGAAAREAGKDAGALAVRFGAKVATPVVSKFGDDGARALASLSPKGAERLAAMADDLAAGGRGRDWMKLIAQRGDEVMEWLKRRGSVAVGAIATAIVLQPEEFLQASQNVATSAIGAAGEHVLEPLIAEGARHIAAPIAQSAAAAFPWRTVWVCAAICLVALWLKEQLSIGAGLSLVKFLETLKGRRKCAGDDHGPNPTDPQ